MVRPSDFGFVIKMNGVYVRSREEHYDGEKYVEMTDRLYYAKNFPTMEKVCEFINENIKHFNCEDVEVKTMVYVK